ncbi:hypothetical protein [Escherichia coli]|uniref:hypothetical protein n=1 Tax=Escherichia coli TaxID=562 RepID=UPI003F4A8A18
MVYLRIPKYSQVMRTGKVYKLSPRFAGPYLILKKINEVAYRLRLPEGIRVHPVFHVSRLKEVLGARDNLVSDHELSRLEDLSVYVPHEPVAIVDRRGITPLGIGLFLSG